MGKKFLILALLTFLPLGIQAQNEKSQQEMFLEAENYLMNEDYADALPLYLKIISQLPGNSNIAYRIGICYLNLAGQKNLATEYLEAAIRKMSSRRKEGSVTQAAAPYDALFHLGIAYRINYQFAKAKEAFGKYLETLPSDDSENIEYIKHEISTCETAQSLIEKPGNYTVENLGQVINNERDNYNPVVSGDGKTIIFMTSLPFYEAVMYSKLVNGKWSDPVNITPDLQADMKVIISGLSSDGTKLIMSQSDNFNSDLYISNLEGGKWSKAVKLNRNINSKYWESQGFITEDGSLLYFSSDRPGGSGGLDIYVSKFENGDWGPAVNLGPEINTTLNEDRPSIISRGQVLFFISQDHENMGGYDIFRSEKSGSGLWKKPENIGYPANTPDDNMFFSPSDNGKSGFVSFHRNEDGYGGVDIYRVRFK